MGNSFILVKEGKNLDANVCVSRIQSNNNNPVLVCLEVIKGKQSREFGVRDELALGRVKLI